MNREGYRCVWQKRHWKVRAAGRGGVRWAQLRNPPSSLKRPLRRAVNIQYNRDGGFMEDTSPSHPVSPPPGGTSPAKPQSAHVPLPALFRRSCRSRWFFSCSPLILFIGIPLDPGGSVQDHWSLLIVIPAYRASAQQGTECCLTPARTEADSM